MLFGAALRGVGVTELLDLLVDEAPPAEARTDTSGGRTPVNRSFSAQVFKVQSGMNPAHRDRLAFVRVCSGVFERGMTVQHAQTARPFTTKYAQQVFGQQRETTELAWPGDIVGLVNASLLRPGDTLYAGEPVTYPPLPKFAPEHFRVATCADAARHKQFRRGLEQLDEEGVIQLLRSDRRGEQAPILAAVGPMQFEVAAERMHQEYGAPIRLDLLPYTIARRTDPHSAPALDRLAECETATRTDGTLIAMIGSDWRQRHITAQHPDLRLDPLNDVSAATPGHPERTPA